MRIVCQQFAPDVVDLSATQSASVAAVREAVDLGADLIVLPELCASGYVFASADEVTSASLTLDAPVIEQWRQCLEGTGAVLVAGFPLDEDGVVFNAAVMLDADGILAVYRKVHLWGEERRWFHEGQHAPPVVDTAHGRIGLVICYDLDFPEMARGLFEQGVEVLAVPTNWPTGDVPPGERPAELHDAMSTARLNRMFLACCDRAGQERGISFAGASAIIGPNGWIRGERPLRDAGTVIADIDLGEARSTATGAHNDVRGDRRPAVYRQLRPSEL